MSKMDGITLLGKLREERRTMFIPVVFVTAIADDGKIFCYFLVDWDAIESCSWAVQR